MIEEVSGLTGETLVALFGGGGDDGFHGFLAHLACNRSYALVEEPSGIRPGRPSAGAVGDGVGQARQHTARALSEACRGASVACGAGLVHDIQHGVAIAVDSHILHGLRVARTLALTPQGTARPTVVVGGTGRLGRFQCLVVGVRDHQHFPRQSALSDDGDEPVVPETYRIEPVVVGHEREDIRGVCDCQKPMCRRNFDAMRGVVSLCLLGLMMALFHRLTAAGPLEARATLALGFLLLAAALGGDLAHRARLPRITGYLLLGFIVGPAWLRMIRADEVAALAFIGDAAVALIALRAGGELRLELLREARAGLTWLTIGAIVFPFAAVALVTLTVAPWFPITVHQGVGDAIAVALVLGTIAAASSPSVTMALMDEHDARGPFARTILGVTVAKDVVVIMLLTVVLAVARPLASEGALHVGVAWTALVHLVASLGVGVVLGLLVAGYLRIVERDTPLFLVGIAFLTAEVGALLGLEAMLIALAAGFYLENFSRVEGERLVAALKHGSRPVYVVFFALAGAGLHLSALRGLWPWILLLVGLRTVGLRYGLQWAGRRPGVTPDLAQYGWLGLISQAGVTLGLATVARRAFPEWGVSLESLIVAMIGIHELAGPVCFRRALALAGELEENSDGAVAAVVERDPASVRGDGV